MFASLSTKSTLQPNEPVFSPVVLFSFTMQISENSFFEEKNPVPSKLRVEKINCQKDGQNLWDGILGARLPCPYQTAPGLFTLL